MSKQLITTTTQQDGTEAVNARDLHLFLEVGRDFSTWIKQRIKKYGFEENVDYVKIHKTGEPEFTEQLAIDYHISLDMGKELSMVQNNESL